MNKVFASLLAVFAIFTAGAQGTSPVDSDGQRESQVYHVFTNARIFIKPDQSFRGTLVIRNGKVVEAGPNVKAPKGSIVRDLKGAFIYPAFIDPASTAGSKPVKRAHSDAPVYNRKDEKSLYWNSAIEPGRNAAEENALSGDSFDKLRNMGVAVVNTHVPDGIVRGTGTTVLTGGENDKDRFVKGRSSLFYSLEKGSSPMDYPSSQMGSIALLNQFFHDVKWYHSTTGKKEYNQALEIFPSLQNLPQIFVLKDKQEILRAAKIGKEHGVQFYFAGSGDEYQRAAELSQLKTALIIPIHLPGPAEVTDPFDAGLVNLSQMKHWELAPHNARILKQYKIPFAFSFEGINSVEQFRKNLLKMIRAGLSHEDALRALTITPAAMLGIDQQTGTLEPGKLANFNIVSDSLFREKSEILETWVRGIRHVHKPVEMTDIRGTYDLNVDGKKIYILKVEGNRWKPAAKAVLKGSTDTIPVTLNNSPELLTLNIPEGKDSLLPQKLIRLSGKINYKSGIWDGKGEDAAGNWINWSAIRKQDYTEKKDTSKVKTYPPGDVLFPFNGYGTTALPDTGIILIRNATVWTNEDTGIVKGTDVLLRNGKIDQMGKGIDISRLREAVNIIDGTGKHLTPGIIDEHSHIAISKGVNEGTQAVTSEVSIGDVVNAEDINIYRQLSGGVTSAQLLHGSANPIGGQSALIKLRWGRSGEEMKIAGAPGFIKFALGENVKQSNWGARHSIRFPQTRMGVEQVFYDAFIRAKEYMREWETYNALSPKEKTKKGITAPRVDLELEALAEILKEERFITCHSYVQSEINMLMHVADSMGFTINTFTHILEGYKVADKMKEHGAGASTFSDWWAYKFEVSDAIPYNAAILNEMGVVTAINSDDAEMGRRLNHEAAKTMKYGGVSEEEALKMVTLNPAKLLHLDHRMGSVKPGKDADLVLWSGHPLSVYSRAEKTIIDGVIYFDREQEDKQREYIRLERNRLVQMMIEARKNGEKPEAPEPAKTKEYHCDTLEP